MSYQIFYWIHVVSYISWLLAFAGSLMMASKVRTAKDTTRKQQFMQFERLATSIGAHLGAVGILISGGAMASISSGPQWGWFSFQLYPWLALKQVFFLIILVLIVFSIRRSRVFKRALKQGAGEEENNEISKKWSSAYRMSLLVYLLVVINTFLGFAKPYLLG